MTLRFRYTYKHRKTISYQNCGLSRMAISFYLKSEFIALASGASNPPVLAYYVLYLSLSETLT